MEKSPSEAALIAGLRQQVKDLRATQRGLDRKNAALRAELEKAERTTRNQAVVIEALRRELAKEKSRP